MKRSIIIFALLVSALVYGQESNVQFQNPEFARLLKENIARAGNNTHCYEWNPIHDTKAPKGYKPFYISHYGRHGARSNWGETQYNALIDILKAAKEDGLLTASGSTASGPGLSSVPVLAHSHKHQSSHTRDVSI